MTIQRMDHVGVVFDDLESAKAFFLELGLKAQGEATVEGGWVDRVVGLEGVRAEIVRDPAQAVEGADLVIADTWVSMHDPQSAKERRHNQLRGYQVNEALMARAKSDSLFMHCLPAHREDEVTSAVMDGPHSVISDEAENRLHAQKAVMRWCLGV